uniref:Uncharacterized protein n=1 Tax=Micrurus lemniscatus lemniscatus TaxID=129467 RepID=A0A2D4JC70_MICLE
MSYGNNMKSLDEGDHYRYPGILQADNLKHPEVKKVRNEYIMRIKKSLKSKLGGKNIIKGMNSGAIPVISYTAGIVDLTQIELKVLDKKARKTITMNHGLHVAVLTDSTYHRK